MFQKKIQFFIALGQKIVQLFAPKGQKIVQFLTTRAALTALGIVVAGMVVWFFFYIRNQEKENSMDAIRAIPSDAVFALRINKLSKLSAKLSSDGELFALFCRDKSTANLVQQLQWVADTLSQESPMVADFVKQSWWVSGHTSGNEIKYVFAANLPNNLYSSDVKQLSALLFRSGYTSVELEYEDEKIITFKQKEADVFHAAVVRRVLVLSSSRVLVEMAIRNARVASSLTDVPNFNAAAATANANEDLNLYVQHAQLPKFLSLFFQSPYSRNIPTIAKFGEFLVLDISLNSNNILLNGFLFANHSKDSYFYVLQGQKPQVLTAFDVLPNMTDGVYSFAVSNAKNLLRDYTNYYNNLPPKNPSYINKIAKLQTQINVEPPQFFADLYPEEVAVAHVPIAGVPAADQWFILIKSSRIKTAREKMNNCISFLARRAGQSEGKFKHKELMTNGNPIDVYDNPVRSLTATLLGNLFAACDDKYFVALGDYFVFSSSKHALKEFALSSLLKRTLSQSVNLSNYTSIESNVFIYLNPKRSDAAYLNVLKPITEKKIRASSIVAASQSMGLQLRFTSNNEAYCNAFYTLQNAASSTGSRSPRALKTDFDKMEAVLLTRPWRLKNHRTNTYELLVQDAKKNIYLYDDLGKMLWKRALDEAIMGDVEQVDVLKNNKLQMVFCTKNKIYLIDRNGKNVDKFPITLPAAATAPLSIFDYDKSRDYRFFVPCSNGKIYAYESNGKPLKGFSPTVKTGGITLPLQHVRQAGKDFIVVADNRNVYLLNRQGEERAKVAKPIFPAVNSSIVCEHNAAGEVAHLTTTNAQGELLFIYLDGKVDKMPLAHALKEYHFFTTNEQNQYIFLNNKELSVYEGNWKKKFSVSTKQPANTAPTSFVVGNQQQFYSVYSDDEKKVYLWDAKGNEVDGFPMPASAPLLVTRLRPTEHNYNIIVGDPNGFLTCYDVVGDN